MTSRQWSTLYNLIMAIGEFLGKKSGHMECAKILGKFSLVPSLGIVCWMVYCYWTNFYTKYREYYLCTLGLMLIMTYRYCIVLTQNLIRGNKIANSLNKDVIGSIMSYSLLLGIAVGNIISLTFPYLKIYFFEGNE